MKAVFLFLVYFLSIPFVYAQIIAFPDPAFKDKLVNHNPTIDTNGDGEIQETEAANFTQTIDISGTPSNPSEVEDLTGLNFFTNIRGFQGNYNEILTADFSNNLLLENITINENPLNVIDVSQNSALNSLSLSGSNLLELTVTNKPNLLFLQANFAQISNLVVNNCPSLQFLYVQSNNINNLDVNDLPSLVALTIGNNPISSIDLSNNDSLVFFNARFTFFTTLDFSNNTDLWQVNVKGNSDLEYINLRNGANGLLVIDGGTTSCNFEDLPLLKGVCIDDVNSSLATYIQSQNSNSINFSEKCELSMAAATLTPIVMYPNPTHDQVKFISPNRIKQVQVFNALGKLIFSQEAQDIKELNLNWISSGVYFLQIQDELQQTNTQKLIKI